MIHMKDNRQLQLFDPWSHIPAKKRAILDSSWPGLFQKEILPELPALKLASFYSRSRGRKSKELYAMLGTLLLQQQLDLTDEQTVYHYIFDEGWHYALNRYEKNDSQYLCLKTLWTVRDIASRNGLEADIFESVAVKLAKVFDVDTSSQRLDSVHIRSNMRKLGRIAICSQAIRKFLKNLKRKDKKVLPLIDPDLVKRYCSKKAFQCFSMVKPSEAPKTLDSVAEDLYRLVRQFENTADVSSMRTFKLLERVLKEQFTVKESDGETIIKAKAPKDIASDSLQNPSDPDASYSGHKGQGYQVQTMETVCKTHDKEEKARNLNLITHAKVERAHESDAHALIPAVEASEKLGLKPKELSGDQSYGSDDNVEAAKEKGVEVISPVKKGPEGKIGLLDFKMNSKGKTVSCPRGKAPVKVNKKKNFSAAFDSHVCQDCPHLGECPVEKGKRHFYLRYSQKDVRLAFRRQYEETDEFKDGYRWRSGIEATFSEEDKKTGLKNLRVRGFQAVRFAAVLKAAGLNVLRAAAVLKARKKKDRPGDEAASGLFFFVLSVKERLKSVFGRFKEKFSKCFKKNELRPAIQADFRF